MLFSTIFLHQTEVAGELEDGRPIKAALSFRIKSRYETVGHEIDARAQAIFSRWAICRNDAKTTKPIYKELEGEFADFQSDNFKLISVETKYIKMEELAPVKHEPPVVSPEDVMVAKLLEKERCAIALHDTASTTPDIDLDGQSLKWLVNDYKERLIRELFHDQKNIR